MLIAVSRRKNKNTSNEQEFRSIITFQGIIVRLRIVSYSEAAAVTDIRQSFIKFCDLPQNKL